MTPAKSYEILSCCCNSLRLFFDLRQNIYMRENSDTNTRTLSTHNFFHCTVSGESADPLTSSLLSQFMVPWVTSDLLEQLFNPLPLTSPKPNKGRQHSADVSKLFLRLTRCSQQPSFPQAGSEETAMTGTLVCWVEDEPISRQQPLHWRRGLWQRSLELLWTRLFHLLLRERLEDLAGVMKGGCPGKWLRLHPWGYLKNVYTGMI